jgi:PAS domain S-box-containing protein
LSLQGKRNTPGTPMIVKKTTGWAWSIGGLAVPFLALLVGGLWFYHAEETSARWRAEQQLASVAHLKAAQFNAWRNERLNDAAALTEDAMLARVIADSFAKESDHESDYDAGALPRRLREIGEHGRYAEVALIDVDGRIRFSLSGGQESTVDYSEALTAALRNYQPAFIDLPPDAHSPGALVSLVAPIYVANRTGVSPLGAFILVSDADQLLRPLLQSWVKPSATTEILLARPEAGRLLLLTEQSDPAEGKSGWEYSRLSTERADSLAAVAVGGGAGFIRGVDHRGVESLAYVLPIPGSEWLLIAKDETAQIFGVWRFRAALLLLLFAVLAAGLGSLGMFVWQLKRKARYKALYDAESRLRHSLERHSIILQAVGDGIVATNNQGMVELLNPVAETLTGWNAQEAVGRPLAEVFCLIDEATRAPVEDLVSRARCGSLAINGGRHLLIAKNGEERAVDETVAPIRDENGEVLGVVLAFRDQTEERRAQRIVRTRLFLREFAFTHSLDEFFARALKETAALSDSPCVRCLVADPRLRALTQPRGREDEFALQCVRDGEEKAGDAVLTATWFARLRDGKTVVCNDRAAMEIDGAAADLVGETRILVVPIMRTGRVVAVLAAADKPTPYTEHDREATAQTADYIWRLVEKKRVEEELLASERQYRTLYRSMMDAFVVVDLQGNIRECNDAYSAMLGYSNDELKRMNLGDITPARWLAYEQEHVMNQLMHGGCSSLYEKEYRRKDGTVFPVELRTFLLVDNNGAPEGVSAIVRDVSERKKVEADQAKLQEQLHQARKMESVGQLAGGVAHDFNNMLSVIIGYAELALRKLEPPPPLDSYFQEIVKAGRRSAEMTLQLLAFARKQNIAPKIIDLNAAVGGMLKMLRRLIGEDIELKWMPGRELWPVKMDPSQMDQLLANLCVNARDAIKDVGKITIETGTISFDEAYCAERAGFVPGDFVLLAVSDNGQGMERDILDKIFEPFFTTKAVGQGTGLGLATVYGVVKQNNGFINVYSEPDVGTTFRIYLPRQTGEIEELREENNKVMPLGKGETLLVVEDEPTILTLNKVMLEQLGYVVLAAGSPDEALQLAEARRNDIRLLITDVIMPEMNGRVLSRLVATCCPGIKTLFMSGYTANVIAHRGVLDEGVCFIAKPFATRELAVKVHEMLHS